MLTNCSFIYLFVFDTCIKGGDNAVRETHRQSESSFLQPELSHLKKNTVKSDLFKGLRVTLWWFKNEAASLHVIIFPFIQQHTPESSRVMSFCSILSAHALLLKLETRNLVVHQHMAEKSEIRNLPVEIGFL